MRFITLFLTISILSSRIHATTYKYFGYNPYIYPKARTAQRSNHGSEAAGKSRIDDSFSQDDKNHLVIVKLPRNSMYSNGGRFGVVNPDYERRMEPEWINRYYDETFNRGCALGKMLSKDDVMMMHPTINTDLTKLYNAKNLNERSRSHVVKKPSSYVKRTKDTKRPIYVEVDRSKKPVRIIPPYQHSRYIPPTKNIYDNKSYRKHSLLDNSSRYNRSLSLQDREKLYNIIASRRNEYLNGFARASINPNERNNDKLNIHSLMNAEKAKRLKLFLDKLYNKTILDYERKNTGDEQLVSIKEVNNSKDDSLKNKDQQNSTAPPKLTNIYEVKKSKPVVINLLESMGNSTLQSNLSIEGENGETFAYPENEKLNPSVVEDKARSAMTDEYRNHENSNEHEINTLDDQKHDKPSNHQQSNYDENNVQPPSTDQASTVVGKKVDDEDYKSEKHMLRDRPSIIVDINTNRRNIESSKKETNVFPSNTPDYIEVSQLNNSYNLSSAKINFDKESTDSLEETSFVTIKPDEFTLDASTHYFENNVRNDTSVDNLSNKYNDALLNNVETSIREGSNENSDGHNEKIQGSKDDLIISGNLSNVTSRSEQHSNDSSSNHYKSYKHLDPVHEQFQTFLWNFSNNEDNEPRNSDGNKRDSPQNFSDYVTHDFVQGQYVKVNPYDKYDEFDKSILSEINLSTYYNSLLKVDNSSVNNDGEPNDQDDLNYESREKMNETGVLMSDETVENSTENGISNILDYHISDIDSLTSLTPIKDPEYSTQFPPNDIDTDNNVNAINSLEAEPHNAPELNSNDLNYLNELPVDYNLVNVTSKPSISDNEVSEPYESVLGTSEWDSSLGNKAINDSSESITLNPTILNESEPYSISELIRIIDDESNLIEHEKANVKQELGIDVSNNDSNNSHTSSDDLTNHPSGDFNMNHQQTTNNYKPIDESQNYEYTPFPTAQTLTTTEFPQTEEPVHNTEEYSINELNSQLELTRPHSEHSYFNNTANDSNEISHKHTTNSQIFDHNNVQMTKPENDSEAYSNIIKLEEDSANNMGGMKIMDMKSPEITETSNKQTLHSNGKNNTSEPDAMSVDEFLKKIRLRDETSMNDKGIVVNNEDSSHEIFTDEYEGDISLNPNEHQIPQIENVDNGSLDDTIYSDKAIHSIPQEDLIRQNYFDSFQNVANNTMREKELEFDTLPGEHTKNDEENNEAILNKVNEYFGIVHPQHPQRQVNSDDSLGHFRDEFAPILPETDKERIQYENWNAALPHYEMKKQQHNSIFENYESSDNRDNVLTNYVQENLRRDVDYIDTQPTLESKERCPDCSSTQIDSAKKVDSKKKKTRKICFTLEENNDLKDEDLLKILHNLLVNKVSGPFFKEASENGESYTITDNENDTNSVDEVFPKNFLNIIAQYINKTGLNQEVQTNKRDNMERNGSAEDDSPFNSEDLSEESSEHKETYNKELFRKEEANVSDQLLPTSISLPDQQSTSSHSITTEVLDLLT